MPIEPRGVVAQPDAPDGRLTVWASTQVPFAVRAAIAAALDLAEEQVRVIAPDVGGGFGAKGHVYPEDVLFAAVARRLRRPVKWIETRREHFLATAPDRDQRHRARLGVARDGTITAVETEFTRDGGAYPVIGDVITLNTINHLPGPYRIGHLKGSAVNVVTHKSFTAAYRGAGRPEGTYVLDRLLDRAARRSGLDPAALRRRNLIRADEMPYTTGLRYRDGVPIVYDPADYPAAFDRLLARFGYDEWRATQQARRPSPRPLGLPRGHGHRAVRGRRRADRSERDDLSSDRRLLTGPGPRDHSRAGVRGRARRRYRAGRRRGRRHRRRRLWQRHDREPRR